MRQIEKYGIFEQIFPCETIELYKENCVTFVKDDTEVTTGAFCMGEQMAVRFMPMSEGIWTCKNALTGTEETFEVVANTGDNHGPVYAKEDRFYYADGKRFVPFGTTCYAWTNQPQELQEETVKTLAAAPFNKIRMCVFPKSMPYNNNEPDMFAFESAGDKLWNVKAPVEAFWQNLDKRLMQLQELGIEADLIVFHPYDRWGFSTMSQEDSMLYLNYLIYRYSAYRNLWWSLANEYETVYYKTMQDWDEYGETLQKKDIYHHLIGVHDIMTVYPDRDWLTHCSIQSGLFDHIKKYKASHANKPVMMDEFGYEGDIEYDWGNKSAYYEMESFWHVMMRGGYATHGETFHRDDEVLWWAKGGKLYGKSPERIAFLKEIISELPEDWKAANRELANPNLDGLSEEAKAQAMFWMKVLDQANEEAKFGFWCGTTPLAVEADGVYLQYVGRGCARVVTLNLSKDKQYEVEVIDAWDMTRTKLEGTFSGDFQVPLPARKGMAVLARAVK